MKIPTPLDVVVGVDADVDVDVDFYVLDDFNVLD